MTPEKVAEAIHLRIESSNEIQLFGRQTFRDMCMPGCLNR